jgi:hypothetical protein
MRDRTPRWSKKGWLYLLSASTCLTSGTALAQVTNYIVINPIDVCDSTGASCAPINNKGQTVLNGTKTAAGFVFPTPIGFIDASGADVTQAMWNKIGITLAYAGTPAGSSPSGYLVQQYKSAPNPQALTSDVIKDYRTLHIQQAANGTLQSPDFLILSQQQNPGGMCAVTRMQGCGIWTGTVPNPTSPAGVPVASQVNVINTFFVNTLDPPSGGQLYGYSWKNNNGIAISASTLKGVPQFLLPPRPDTIAHEIGHNLDLDHNNHGAGPDPVTNACSTTPFTGCTVNLLTAGGNGNGNLRTEPSGTGNSATPAPGGALYVLAQGTGDQMNLSAEDTQLSDGSQQTHAFMSGFVVNPIGNSMVMASHNPPGLATPAVAAASLTATPVNTTAAASTATAGNSAQGNTTVYITVTGPDVFGETLDTFIIAIDKHNKIQFDPQNQATFNPPHGISVKFNYVIGNAGNGPALGCGDPATECLVIQLSPGLGFGQDLFFTQGFRKPPGPLSIPDEFAAASPLVTFGLSDGLTITSPLNQISGGVVVTDSQHPLPGTSPTVDLNKYYQAGNSASGCTLTFDALTRPAGPTGNNRPAISAGASCGTDCAPPPPICQDPTIQGGADGLASEEGGQPPGPTGGSAPH